MELVDTHCHLDMQPLARDPDGVLARARAAGVTRIVAPAYDRDSWPAVAALGRRPGVFPALGIHPWAVTPGLRLDPAELRRELRACGAVAIGEIGLDGALEGADLAAQQRVLRCQLELARELELPVILHCRKAFDELLATLEQLPVRGVVHAYSRSPTPAEQLVTRHGLMLGFGGSLTRPRARRPRTSVTRVPAEALLLETDAPSIPVEGVDQVEPCHVAVVARCAARLRGLPVAQLARETTDNARRLFGLP